MSLDPTALACGRYAPSPSGDLHLGNLRTALLAWLFARQARGRFVLRVDDLDRVQPGAAERQLADLAFLGLDWDGPVLYQSSRLQAYTQALAQLQEAGLVYECFCSRREILEASRAPHGAPGSYPGTCRGLTEAERAERRAHKQPSLRLKAQVSRWTVQDRYAGAYTDAVDDFVLLRADGVFAYNLASVLDDAYQGVTEVVRGADLLASAPRQAYLAHLLGLPIPSYTHVPLALNAAGQRLAKRDGAVTLGQLRAAGVSREQVLTMMAASLPLPPLLGKAAGSAGPHLPESPQEMLQVFDPQKLSSKPWLLVDPLLEGCCGL